MFRHHAYIFHRHRQSRLAFAATILARVLAIAQPILRAHPEPRHGLPQSAVVLQKSDATPMRHRAIITKSPVHGINSITGANLAVGRPTCDRPITWIQRYRVLFETWVDDHGHVAAHFQRRRGTER